MVPEGQVQTDTPDLIAVLQRKTNKEPGNLQLSLKLEFVGTHEKCHSCES